MKDEIFKKFKESILAILPVMFIMLLTLLLLQFSKVTIISLFISTILLVIGIYLFTYGADLSMVEIGKVMGTKLLKTKKPILIGIISFLIGVIITVAEPDLKVLAAQMTAIDDIILILFVGIGVGIFLCIATLRILYQINLKILIMIFYILILVMMFFINLNIIPISFDSGGVTTGPISVPFIMAMGLGFSSSRSKKKSKDDSFGLIALCSIGPILTVLLMSVFLDNNILYSYNISNQILSYNELISRYLSEIGHVVKDVLLSLSPIILLFIIFNIKTKSIKGRKLKKVISGIFITFLGLCLFFIGVYAGYMNIAYLIGIRMFQSYEWLLIFLGIIIGLVIVKAEPAVQVLTEQIENITNGNIKKSVMINTIAFGVAIAIAISIFRALNDIDIKMFLLIGYIIALILMLFTPKVFTMVAFDSGGAVSGPMVTSFLLPLVIGVCYANGGNVLTCAFGVVSLVALSPLITIQLLGIIYKYKLKHIEENKIEETIIEYDWRNINE